MKNYLDLSGRAALITGASSGIGAATAEVLAGLGAKVALGYHANEQGAADACGRIAAAGGKAVAIRADVSRPDEARRVVREAAEALGPLDILVNNAGSLVRRTPIRDVTEEGWDEIFNLNLKSALICAQAAMPAMIKRKRGAIVNVVSIAGRNGGGPGAVAYATAKGALITLPREWRAKWPPSECG